MARWYIIHAYSGFENKVRDSVLAEAERMGLTQLVESVEVPVETVTEVKRGKKIESERKLHPGYVYVNMYLRDEEKKLVDRTWYFVRETNGVIGFADGDNPQPIRADEV